MDDKEFKEMQPEDNLIDDYRYGIISKKEDERSLDDMYLILPDLHSSENADKKVDFSLFGVFDGHNSNYVAKYISENIKALYEKETASIKNENYKVKIEEIFKTIDKNLKEEEDKKDNDIIKENEKKPENEIIENANVINDNNDNIINTEKKEKEKIEKKEKKHYINVGVDEKEINLFKEVIQNSNDIPEELKKVDDSQIKDLLLFRNLFKYNNNYLYNDNDVDYIGSSASIVLINDTNVITADLGITKCILFNKEGEIKNMKDLNPQDIYEKLKNTHTFNSKDEKKRVKKFNKTIDYNNLTLNIYVPASRCFGLYKYKQDEILKPENQIISCVPDVNCFNKNEIDYILLLTKGMINLIGNDLKGLITKIVNALNGVTIDNKDFKITKIIEEYISQKKLDEEHNKQNNTIKNKDSGLTNKQLATKTNSSIYIGKDDFSEENIIINELNNNYYKDIMNMNKNNDPSFSGKLNTTCVLIQLYKTNKKKEDKKVEDNIIINEDNKEEVKKEDNNNNNQIKEKVENKIEEEKKEGGENKIEEINVIEEKKPEVIEEKKENDKKEEENKKEEEKKIEEIKLEIKEENKNEEVKVIEEKKPEVKEEKKEDDKKEDENKKEVKAIEEIKLEVKEEKKDNEKEENKNEEVKAIEEKKPEVNEEKKEDEKKEKNKNEEEKKIEEIKVEVNEEKKENDKKEEGKIEDNKDDKKEEKADLKNDDKKDNEAKEA